MMSYMLLDLSNSKIFKWFEPVNDLEKQTCLVEMYVSGYIGTYPSNKMLMNYLKACDCALFT